MSPEISPERLRVGDAERDEVTSALHEHFAQGRLDREELDERLTATLSARTAGDLREVVRDLPGTATPVRPRTRGRPTHASRTGSRALGSRPLGPRTPRSRALGSRASG